MSDRRAAYIFLTLAALFWAGNFVLARAVHAAVPPIGLAFWRWALVAILVVPWAWKDLKSQWPAMRAHIGLILILGTLSVGAFNTLVYIGVQTTSAVNALMLISAIPMFILALAPILLGNRLVGREILGVAISATGVLVVLTHGHPLMLASLVHHKGNLWVLAGVLSWALYSVLLRRLPRTIGGFGLFAATVVIGLTVLLPFYLFETLLQHRPVAVSSTLIISVAYTALFASILAYLFWNKAVALIGAERAGVFIHLMPAFGLVLSALWLGEVVAPIDLIGLGLILAGLVTGAVAKQNKPVTDPRPK